MDINSKIDKVLEELVDQTVTADITPQARDEFLQKKAVLDSLRDK